MTVDSLVEQMVYWRVAPRADLKVVEMVEKLVGKKVHLTAAKKAVMMVAKTDNLMDKTKVDETADRTV